MYQVLFIYLLSKSLIIYLFTGYHLLFFRFSFIQLFYILNSFVYLFVHLFVYFVSSCVAFSFLFSSVFCLLVCSFVCLIDWSCVPLPFPSLSPLPSTCPPPCEDRFLQRRYSPTTGGTSDGANVSVSNVKFNVDVEVNDEL